MNTFHFVYKTTNLINSKFYIGKHSTTDLNDGYLGSGTYLLRSTAKYGKENFSREILKQFHTSDEAYEYEKELITEELLKSEGCYNLALGGKGGVSFPGSYSEERISKISENAKRMWEDPTVRTKIIEALHVVNKDPRLSKLRSKNSKLMWVDPKFVKYMSDCRKALWKDEDYRRNQVEKRTGANNYFYGKTHTEEVKKVIKAHRANQEFSKETRQKLSDSLSGEKNPFYGKSHSEKTRKELAEKCGGFTWVTDGRVDVQTRDVEEYLKENPTFKIGRAPRVWITNFKEIKRILKVELEAHLSEGWSRGRKLSPV